MLSIRFWSILALTLCVAGVTGCQSSPYFASNSKHPSNTQGTKEYAQRMLLVAQKFEEQGYKQKALGMYRSLAVNSPVAKQANQRIIALTFPEKFKPAPLKTSPKTSPNQSKTVLAKRSNRNVPGRTVSKRTVSRTTKPRVIFPDKKEIQIVADNKGRSKYTYKPKQKATPKASFKFPKATYEVASNDTLPAIIPNNIKATETKTKTKKRPVGRFPAAVVKSNPKPKQIEHEMDELPPSPFEKTDFPVVATIAKAQKSFEKPVVVKNQSGWSSKKKSDKSSNHIELSAESLLVLCPNATGDLEYLVSNLASNSDTQKESLIELASIGEKAIPALPAIETLLLSNDKSIQAQALYAKTQIDGPKPETVQKLAELLDSDDAQVVETSTYYLGSLESAAKPAVSKLRTLLQNGDSLVRLNAAESILKISPKDEQASTTILEVLKRGDDDVRWLAAYAVASVSTETNPDVIDELSHALYDTDPRVQEAAALTLGGFGNSGRKALDELIRVSHTQDMEKNPGMKAAVQIALECIESN